MSTANLEINELNYLKTRYLAEDKKVGQITEKVIVKNFVDIAKLSERLISEDAVRTVEIESFVDTGAAFLCLPPSVIAQLAACRRIQLSYCF